MRKSDRKNHEDLLEFTQVLATDYSGRFIDAATKLQRGETLPFHDAETGTSGVAAVPAGSDVTNVIFKQVLYAEADIVCPPVSEYIQVMNCQDKVERQTLNCPLVLPSLGVPSSGRGGGNEIPVRDSTQERGQNLCSGESLASQWGVPSSKCTRVNQLWRSLGLKRFRLRSKMKSRMSQPCLSSDISTGGGFRSPLVAGSTAIPTMQC